MWPLCCCNKLGWSAVDLLWDSPPFSGGIGGLDSTLRVPGGGVASARTHRLRM